MEIDCRSPSLSLSMIEVEKHGYLVLWQCIQRYYLESPGKFAVVVDYDLVTRRQSNHKPT